MQRTKTLLLAGCLAALAASSASARSRGPGAPAVDAGAESASHRELKPLAIRFNRLSSLCLHTSGNLLACDLGAKEIKVINSAGRQTGSIKLSFGPEAIDAAPDGTIYCGGQGMLAILDKNGRLLKTAQAPGNVGAATGGRQRSRSLQTRVSGIAVSDKDVFASFGSGWSLGSRSKLFRFDRGLGNPQMLAEGLRGCCQRCDIVFKDGVLYLAENAAHRVVSYDRDGKVLGKWGARSRTGLEGFGSCCNPMNLCFGPGGELYTAESGLGRVKRYSADGKLLGLVGHVGVERFTRAGGLAASCSNIAIAVTPDGKRVYVMDYKNNQIRVLEKKR